MRFDPERAHAERLALRLVGEARPGRYSPRYLVALLRASFVPEDAARAAVLGLLDRGELVLTKEWRVVLP